MHGISAQSIIICNTGLQEKTHLHHGMADLAKVLATTTTTTSAGSGLGGFGLLLHKTKA
jgi:hypothetical protein